MSQCRWAIFVSGQGSNLGALIDLRPMDLALVVSSRADAPAVGKARSANIPVLVLPAKIDWEELLQSLKDSKISHIFLAGFMKVIPASFLKAWSKPILNVHPSLLPAYPGLQSMERAYQDGAAMGVTVHKVTADVDAGEIVAQKQVYAAGEARNYKFDDVKVKMHQAEHEIVKSSFLEASCWT